MNTIKGMIEDLSDKNTHIGGCTTVGELIIALERLQMLEEKQPCEDCIRELIREFDNKHPALFADYMREFNNHPISEIIEYMWDMHDLIEDIKYRLPNEGGAESEDKG